MHKLHLRLHLLLSRLIGFFGTACSVSASWWIAWSASSALTILTTHVYSPTGANRM